MHRTITLAVAAGLLSLACGYACADEIQKNLDNQRNLNAIQTVYQKGVPHTDQNAHTVFKYDADRSFFPVGMWGAPAPGTVWDEVIDWKVLQDGGINLVWPWPSDTANLIKAGKDYNMKIVLMNAPKPEDLKTYKDDPTLFGIVWMDEPIGGYGSRDMDKLFNEYQAYRREVHRVIPRLPVFINDAPWIMEPARNTWIKWNTSAEISCHDNYPIMDQKKRAESIGAEPNGIPQSVGLAVAANKEKKPVWLIVGAFEQPGDYGQAFAFRYPSPEQLRACVYSGIIHGATGISYFIWDNYVPRDGAVIGISPNPKVAYVPNPQKEGYTKPTPASPIQLIKAKALWETMTQINSELKQLTPTIYSPTVGSDFKYSLDIVGVAPTSTPVRCLMKPAAGGGYMLLSVNQDDAVLQVTYTMPSAVKSAEVLFENRQPLKIGEDGKSFTLTYHPFDTHVIKIEL